MWINIDVVNELKVTFIVMMLLCLVLGFLVSYIVELYRREKTKKVYKKQLERIEKIAYERGLTDGYIEGGKLMAEISDGLITSVVEIMGSAKQA